MTQHKFACTCFSALAALSAVLCAGGLLTDRATSLARKTGFPLGILQLVAGGYSAYALTADETAWAWGDDLEGQLGDGMERFGSDVPVHVPRLTDVSSLAASSNSAYALGHDGTVWAWGDNSQGQLGGEATAQTSDVPALVHGLPPVSQITAGGFSAYALARDGTVWGFGDNAFGELAESLAVGSSATPVHVRGLRGVVQISAGISTAYALGGDGTLWAWGDNAFGEMARPTTLLGSEVPLKIGRLEGVSAISASSYTAVALRRDATVWAWGYGGYGQLGDGRNASSDVPVAVKGLEHVVRIAAGGNAAYALQADGTVWAWGYGAYGQLGDGSNASSDVPVEVQGL